MPSVLAVIFDFDGVIADTERLHLGAFQEVFAARGWTLEEEAYFDRYLGYDDHGLVAAYAQDQQLALEENELRELVRQKTDAFSRHLSSPEIVYAGARRCMEQLAARYKLGIASGALHAEIASILRAAELIDLFPVIVGADDVSECKPSPAPYLVAATRLGVEPAACVAVEDSVAGLAAARAAGMRTIGVTTTTPRDALAFADYVIESLREVSPELIESLATGRGANGPPVRST
jgi:HAD superfamily hydrolase (TIGR01509 family)